MSFVKILVAILFVLPFISSGQNSITIGKYSSNNPGPFLLEGTVYDAENGDPLIGVNISIPSQNTGTTTDVNGAFSIELGRGIYEVQFSFTGYSKRVRKINLQGDGRLNLGLSVLITELSF